jgi:dihydroorotate dehydrogenase (fumarate)
MTMTRDALDLGTTVAGVRFPFAAMNAAGAWSSTMNELRELARSAVGGIVLKSATVHPFVHPEYRSLHNPGYDKLLPLVRELAESAGRPVVASIGGATADEYAILGRAFTSAGVAMIEANLADPYVAATLAPCDDLAAFRALLAKLVPACGVPLAVKLPERLGLPYRRLGTELTAAGVHVVVMRNDFAGYEKFLLEAGRGFEVIVVGGVASGYDVTRARAKGARAVQIGTALVREGPGIFARLEREMRIAHGGRPE